MKTCPTCKTTVFEDMEVCYACLHRFEGNAINLNFESCSYGEDFEALVYADEFFNWLPKETFDLWFKAYDTSMRESEEETALHENGYAFECCVYFSPIGEFGKRELLNHPAKTREDAETWLQNAANTISDNVEVAETVKRLANEWIEWSATRVA